MKVAPLLKHQIYCWTIDLDAYRAAIEIFAGLLTKEEQKRAECFAFKILKERYVIAHGILHHLLQKYLHGASYQISLGQYGKPYLENHSLYFNLSHSDQYACVVMSLHEIGVDIEKIQKGEILESIFSEQEQQHFQQLNHSLKDRAFYQAWVSKEAYVKALGTGFLNPPHEVEVGFKTPPGWSFISIEIAEQYVGCIATPIPTPSVVYKNLNI